MPNEEQIVAENIQREAEVAAPKANFALLSNDKFLNGTYESGQTSDPVQPVIETTVVEPVEEKELALENTSDKTVETNETTEVSTGTETVTEEPKDEDLTLSLDDETTTTEEDLGWKAIGKLEGIDLKEDSYEALKEALVTPLKQEIEKVKSLTKEQLFKDLPEDHRLYLELAESGMTQEDIVAPLRNIQQYKGMTSVELYRADLEATFPTATPEFIDTEVEKQIESGNIEHEATKIRLNLDLIEKEIIAERQQKIEQYKINRENLLQEKRKVEVETMVKTLNNMSEFMGSPLTPEVKKGLSERYVSGKYDQMMNDPEMKAKFIAWTELGEKAQKNIEAKSYMKGKLEISQKLHNTPPLEKVGAGKSTTTTENSNFGKLKNDQFLKGS